MQARSGLDVPVLRILLQLITSPTQAINRAILHKATLNVFHPNYQPSYNSMPKVGRLKLF